MKHPVYIVVLTALIILCVSCGNSQEKEKEMIQQQISMTQDQVEGIESGRSKLQKDLNDLRMKVADLNGELSKSSVRLVASKKFKTSLHGMLLGEPEETPLQYVARKPAFTQKVVWILLLCLFVIWLLWRIKHNETNGATTEEIDRVIKRLSDEASRKIDKKTDSVTVKPKPAQEKTVKAPEPEITNQPEPEAVKKEEVIQKPAPKPEPVEEVKQEKTPVKPAEKSPEPVVEKPVKQVKKAAPKKTTTKKTSAAKKTTKRAPKKKVTKRAPAKKCKVEGCNNKHRSKGYCNKHYQQWRRETLEEDGDK